MENIAVKIKSQYHFNFIKEFSHFQQKLMFKNEQWK